MSDWPKITIVTPSFNQGQYLEDALKSVLSQNYPNLEYLVMDGASRDGSVDIIKKYEKQLAYWISAPDNGQSHAIHRGFERATGEILGWLNSDDVLMPDTLKKIARFWQEHPGCHFVCGDGQYMSADGNIEHFYVKAAAYAYDDLLEFYNDKYLPQPSVFFSRQAYENVGGLDARWRYGLDLDLWLRLRKDYPLYYLPQLLSKMRVHEESKTCKESVLFMRELRAIIQAHSAGSPRLKRTAVRWGMRRAEATQACRSAMAFGAEDAKKSRALFWQALWLNPGILFSRTGLRAAARLCRITG